MHHQDIDLASQCFKKVQFADPEWALGWLGQAFVALGSLERFELIEHAFNLGKSSEMELFYFYAYEVFQNPEKVRYDLSDAAFALLKCCESQRPNPTPYNLYGLILEKQGQFELAESAFSKAISLLGKESGKKLYGAIENRALVLAS